MKAYFIIIRGTKTFLINGQYLQYYVIALSYMCLVMSLNNSCYSTRDYNFPLFCPVNEFVFCDNR